MKLTSCEREAYKGIREGRTYQCARVVDVSSYVRAAEREAEPL